MSTAPLRATSLQDLKALKRRIEDAAREQAEQIARQREREAAERRERELFARTVGPVVPLKPSRRALLARPQPAPE
ncbi:MAG TPA: DNA mismatch repair protein MutS, partial [Methylibium sp.]|nr:DNA mismatch repair protein MutS [Methylibium sp.]